MIRGGSRSFFAASLLLPDDVRVAAYALYGFCRLSDDAVDIDGGQAGAVLRLRARLDRIYAGDPSAEPVDRALTDSVLRFRIPRLTLDALLEGLEWDVDGRTYETLSDTYAYAARVAGSVGAMMAALMGARTPDLVARACDLGVAMQLTNIARDVGEDARTGRLYLPRAWLREAGVDPDDWLATPCFRPEIATVVARLLRRAEDLYGRADSGIANLDPAYRPAIFAARYLYAEIGARIEKRGFDSVSSRASVPFWRKAQLVARSVARASRPPPAVFAGPPLPETSFLVVAVDETTKYPRVHQARWRRTTEDIAWTIELFANLERRSRVRASAPLSRTGV
jgi:phytoene synthase